MWDSVVSIFLIIMCISTPIYISFAVQKEKDEIDGFHLLNITMDVVFGIDIIFVFFSAFYDENFKIVDKLGVICCTYLRGWFIIDIIAIIPFDLILV